MSFFPSVYGGIDYKRYNADQFVAATDYLLWTKPRGARFVYVLLAGPGHPGSGGLAVASGTAGSGAGGGGGVAGRALVPAAFFPPQLYVQVGKSGPATAPGAAASAPARASSLLMRAANGSFTALATSVPGTAAGAPSISAGGTAGGGGTLSSAFYLIPWVTGSNQGQVGNITGTGGNATTGVITQGAGASGAGCPATYAAFNGGVSNFQSVLDGRVYNTIAGVGSASGGTNGSDGQTIWFNDGLMFQSCGGAGGGNASTGTAGNGGAGGLGSGGGGGGAASGAGGVGGSGGPGGDGVIIIACW